MVYLDMRFLLHFGSRSAKPVCQDALGPFGVNVGVQAGVHGRLPAPLALPPPHSAQHVQLCHCIGIASPAGSCTAAECMIHRSVTSVLSPAAAILDVTCRVHMQPG